MILGDPLLEAIETAPGQSRITLDGLFRRVAARRPGAIALADAPNRDAFTDRAPLRLTYAEADRAISAIAGRLRRMGLTTDAVVGIQMPNVAENILTILGVLRAGLIAAPLPLLWRRADVVTALARVGAKALITMSRVGDVRHCQFATRVAAEVFSIRYVCGFGRDLPDGVVPLDDVFVVPKLDPIPPLDRDGNAAAHLAVTTFEVGEDGPVPVARRHLEFLTGGLGVLLESRIEQDGAVLSAIAPVSFAGICLTLVPWLLTGGTLVLHHPFAFDIFARQRRDDRCRTLILPAPIAYRLAETGLFAHEGPTTVLAAWHAPERLAGSADWPERDAVLVDVSIFGEAGIVAAWRGRGAARGRQRGDHRRARRDRNRHRGAARSDGAAPRLSAQYRTLRPAAFFDSARRFCRYRLPVRRRCGEQDRHRHRSAGRHRQCRRLPLPALRAAANRRPHRSRCGTVRLARSADRPAPHRHCRRSGRHAGGAELYGRQPAGDRRVCRPRRARFARSHCRGLNGPSELSPIALTAH
jgi:hypothetical protein